MISTPGCKHNKIWNTCEECRPNLANPSGLFEKLAAIEHERWADWQRYVHSKMTPSADDGIWLIGEAFIDRWERQIRTPYADLTEEEKESDRNQVRRYWDLITVPNERSEELPCYCAEINSRNCPKHQNSEESADWKEILEEAKRFIADSFIYRPDWTVQDGDRRKPEQTWEEGKNVVISYLPVLINRTIQAERTRIIKALEGLKKEPGGKYCGCDGECFASCNNSYNEALDQAIKAVEEKE